MKLLEGEKHLIDIDEELIRFSKTYGMKLSKNHQDYPERSLTWKDEKMKKILQIYKGEGKKDEYFYVWGAVFRDISFKRYIWKTEPKPFLVPLDWETIKNELIALRAEMTKITVSSLKPAGNV